MAVNPPNIVVPDPSIVRFTMGDFYWEPTDLNDPVNGYGTKLGSVNDTAYLMPGLGPIPVDGEEFGLELVDKIGLGMRPVMFVALKEHSALAYKLGFAPYHDTNSDSWEYGSQEGVGNLRSADLTGKLLFVPYDRQGHNACIMYKAMPELEATARLAKALIAFPQILPIVFEAKADDCDRVIKVHRLDSIGSLTCPSPPPEP